MMGLVIIFFFLLYLAISAGVVWFFAKKAKQRGIAGWKWGVPAGLVMYLLVFWDHIPTLIAHKYYCDKYAGLSVYKTPEQWKAENPGVAETLETNKYSKRYESSFGSMRFDINQRIAWDKLESTLLFNIQRVENILLDKKSNTVLVRQIDFNTDVMNLELGARNYRDYKIWLGIDSCQHDVKDRQEFYKLEAEIESMGGVK